METSSTPINLRQGSELALGVRVEDPEGKAIRADNFRAIINGVEDDTVAVQGSGPFYKVLWNPPDLGSYSIRLQVGERWSEGISQPLDVRVSAGLEPIIRMVSPLMKVLLPKVRIFWNMLLVRASPSPMRPRILME